MNLRDLIVQLLSYRGPGPQSGASPKLAGRRPIPGVSDASGAPVMQRGGPAGHSPVPPGVILPQTAEPPEVAPFAPQEITEVTPLPPEDTETTVVDELPGGQNIETFPGAHPDLNTGDTEADLLRRSRLRQDLILRLLERAGQPGSAYTR